MTAPHIFNEERLRVPVMVFWRRGIFQIRQKENKRMGGMDQNDEERENSDGELQERFTRARRCTQENCRRSRNVHFWHERAESDQVLEDRARQVVSTSLQIDQKFDSTREALARTLRRRVSAKHLQSRLKLVDEFRMFIEVGNQEAVKIGDLERHQQVLSGGEAQVQRGDVPRSVRPRGGDRMDAPSRRGGNVTCLHRYHQHGGQWMGITARGRRLARGMSSHFHGRRTG